MVAFIFKMEYNYARGVFLAEVSEVKRATAGFVVSLIGGIIDAIVAVLLIAAASWIGEFREFMPGYGVGPGAGVAATALTIWGTIGLILAILVIIGAFLIYMPGKEVIGGILVLVFSIISLAFTAGGLLIGLILGIIGGALGIAKK
ncbi:hypothetical protein GWO13_02370 [Candidatus Bathyarchaeota archaeon]|nr:hypothetical protein [Candidatus Bathyarchaeota archaeon]